MKRPPRKPNPKRRAKALPPRPPPPWVLTILEFADGVRLETTENVAFLVAQHHAGSRIFKYQLVSEVTQSEGEDAPRT